MCVEDILLRGLFLINPKEAPEIICGNNLEEESLGMAQSV